MAEVLLEPTFNQISLAQEAATIATAMGIEAPHSAEPPVEFIAKKIQQRAGGNIEKVLMYNPDAVGLYMFQKYFKWYETVYRHADICVPYRSPMKSVTPVCFATMYTGALPEVHGIKVYKKPVLTVDTLFDALVRSGKRVAIVAVKGSSIASIFLNRDLDYNILPPDTDDYLVESTVLELLNENKHDFIVAYGHDYDAEEHKSGPESPASLGELKKQIEIFDRLCTKAREVWRNCRTLVAFAPDHGAHLCANGKGSHGEEIPEDLNILHFYGAYPARK
ncbi:MAG: hypothetical protein GX303_02645 [Clostridiales bacterium]|nr:hypothetical protein [Clostridiales bacterium]